MRRHSGGGGGAGGGGEAEYVLLHLRPGAAAGLLVASQAVRDPLGPALSAAVEGGAAVGLTVEPVSYSASYRVASGAAAAAAARSIGLENSER